MLSSVKKYRLYGGLLGWHAFHAASAAAFFVPSIDTLRSFDIATISEALLMVLSPVVGL